MPCDTKSRAQWEQEQRARQLADLERLLKEKSARIVKNGTTVSIEGWQSRGEWCDECAIRALRQTMDFEVRHIVAHAIGQEHGHVLTFGHQHEHPLTEHHH